MQRTKSSIGLEQVKNLAIEAFRSDNFLIINKKLIIALGFYPAILLSNYIDRFEYFKEKYPNNNGWFYLTHKQLKNQLNLKEYTIKKTKTLLVSYKLLEVKMYGYPVKEWLRIDFVRLIKLLEIGPPETGLLVPPETGGHKSKPNTINILCPKKQNSTASSKPTGSNIPIVSSLFETFWKIYPKKASKGDALTAWNKICHKPPQKRPTWRQVKSAIILQKRSEQWQNKQFIANASTWLNNSRWLNDPKTMKDFKKNEEKKFIIDDGRRYDLCPDGRYRQKSSGDLYIP